MVETILNILIEFWKVLGEMSPYLLFGFFVAGILSIFISPEMVKKHLGKSGIKDVFKASLLGVPLPLCSCGVIPVAASLRRSGASSGATTSFLISTPQTGIDSILVTYALLGPVFAILKPIVAFISGIAGGVLVNILADKKIEAVNSVAQCSSECCSEDSKKNKLIQALHHGFITIPRDIGWPLIVGLVIAGLISVILPDDFFAGSFGSGIVSMIVIMLISIPIYVCSTSSVPIAAALIMKGLSPGAALVLLIAGPATNAATIATIWKLLGKRATFIYLATMAITALLSGIIIDAIQANIMNTYMLHQHESFIMNYINNISAIILLLVIAFSFYKPKTTSNLNVAKDNQISYSFIVEGMTCMNCVEKIDKALRSIEPTNTVSINIKDSRVTVSGSNINKEIISKAIINLGYNINFDD
ncbi:MAG: SO_0444 family Cu/Zn efflux transporter [Cyanobacteriota bacterium]